VNSLKQKLSFFVALVLVAIVSYLLLNLPFAAVHEILGHALACRLFGNRIISLSFDHVTYESTGNTFVATTIGLAGGMVQALVTLPFLWSVITMEKNMDNQRNIKQELLKKTVLFGLEIAFLTIAFNGVITGMWEGFFYESYSQVHANSLLWRTIDFVGGILSFSMLYRYKQKIFAQLIG
jgi:hypothetical protein